MDERVINEQQSMDADPYEINLVTLPMLIRYLKYQANQDREYNMGHCSECLLAGFSGEVLGATHPSASPRFSTVRGKNGLVPCTPEVQRGIQNVLDQDLARNYWTAGSLYSGLIRYQE